MSKLLVFLTLLMLILNGGCAQRTEIPAPVSPTMTALPLAPPPTPKPNLTLDPTQTLAPSPTHTQTPALTPTPIPNPMEIELMRRGSYPGSDIVIDKELEKGANYRRYYASYLSEGLKIYGLLTIPTAPMPAGGYPALVFLHGYIAPSDYRTTEHYLAYTDWLSRSGYVVYKIDLRGHDRSEGVAEGAYAAPGYTVDVLNAVASLQRSSQVNAQKIGVWGHSMGGFLALRAMVISRGIKAGVIWAGLVASYPDIVYRWRPLLPGATPSPALRGWTSEWIQRYGTPEEDPDFWRSVSATSFLADLSGPLQLHHGKADTTVPVVFSEELAAAAKAAGGAAELYTYPGDNHNLANNFSTAMNRTIRFFDQYLK